MEKRILVVDDEIVVRELNSDMLGEHHSVDTAVDGVDGFYKAVSGDYDLIVSDITMPRANGIDMLRHIRQETSRKTPCIFVTGGTPSLDLPKRLAAWSQCMETILLCCKSLTACTIL